CARPGSSRYAMDYW
nr:immunoglobulin heavy chain junction region [Mus musculus]MBK4189112.1 immunoglobulin heavy chain junction region [Mus musculus]